MEKHYLGDAVYYQHDGYYVILTTEDGLRTSNRILLEPSVLEMFLMHIEKVREKEEEED